MSDRGTSNAYKMPKLLSLKKQWNTGNDRGPLGNDNDLATIMMITMILNINNNYNNNDDNNTYNSNIPTMLLVIVLLGMTVTQ